MRPRGRVAFAATIVALAAASALRAGGQEWHRPRGRLAVLTSPTEVARLVAPLPAAGDELGRSVAVGPGVIVVGAPGDVLNGTTEIEGVAHVFVGGGGRWHHRQRLVAPDRELGDSFGRSVAVDGDTLAVGAEHDDHDDISNSGSVYVFVRSARTWTLEAKLTAPEPGVEVHFGHSLALDGDTLAVGTWATDTVYVFERTGAWWSEPQVVRATPEQAGNFGHSLTLDGDRMVVGAEWRWSTSVLLTAGGASVFERVNQEWVLEQDLAAGDPGSNDRFGSSVAIDGDLIVVGAPEDEDGSNENSGSAYVFGRVDGEWVELQKLVPFAASPWQRFGWSVSVAGANLLVGSPWDSAGSVPQAGCICLFRPSGGSWVPSCLLTANAAAPGDLLGETAISGHTAVLGARLADVDGRADAGAAYVFLLP